jgi:hypothetical protein
VTTNVVELVGAHAHTKPGFPHQPGWVGWVKLKILSTEGGIKQHRQRLHYAPAPCLYCKVPSHAPGSAQPFLLLTQFKHGFK